MVAFLGLFQHHKILIKHLFLRERDTVDTSHLFALGITAPEGTGSTRNLHSLDQTCAHEVRTATKVGESTLCICRNGTVFQVLLDVLTLVCLSVIGKLLQCIGLADLLAHHRLVLLGEFHHLCLNLREIVLADGNAVFWHHIIKESVFHSRSETELDTRIQLLQRLCQQVGGSVPEGMLTLFVVKLIEGNRCVLHNRTV